MCGTKAPPVAHRLNGMTKDIGKYTVDFGHMDVDHAGIGEGVENTDSRPWVQAQCFFQSRLDQRLWTYRFLNQLRRC